MSKKESETEILETSARERIRKDVGEEELNMIEGVMLSEKSGRQEIVETKTRERLRKELGGDELTRIEEEILRDEW